MIAGGFLLLLGKITPFGRLPGDIFYQKGNFTFYFPWSPVCFEYPFDIDCQSFSAPLKSIGITASQAALGFNPEPSFCLPAVTEGLKER